MLELNGYGLSLLLGMVNTVKLSAGALVIGFFLGGAGAVAKLSASSFLRCIANGLTTIIRGIPELLFIFGLYLGSSVVVNSTAQFFGYQEYIDINAFWAGIIALSIVFGAYATEVFRGAILAVPEGQVLAAKAFGFTPYMTFRRIIIPQMWRGALPGLGNLFLVLLKNTALLSVIGVQDLMRNADSAVGYTHKPFVFYLVATALYQVLTAISMLGIRILEKRAGLGVKQGF
nr:ABC transporter permease subunit [uncultured Desulfobulbus sp.]